MVKIKRKKALKLKRRKGLKLKRTAAGLQQAQADFKKKKELFQQEAFSEDPCTVILADCPWDYENYRKSCNGAASAAMKTMTTKQICSIPVQKWAARNSLLVLYGTFPRILSAFKVAHAWGFLEDGWWEEDFTSKQYKSGFPWVKTVTSTGNISTGIGHWTQGTSELVFLFTKGKLKKKTGNAVKGLIHGEKGQPVFYCPSGSKHSGKPEELQDWLSRIAGGRKLELFARRPKHGWQTWGLDTGFELSERGVHALYPEHMDCLPDDHIPF